MENKDFITASVEQITEYLSGGAEPDNHTIEGKNSPLCFACQYNRTEIARLLIEAGADVNFKGFHGRTPLFYAADKQNIEVVDLLFRKGADINMISKDGKNILMDIAGHKPGAEIIRWLIDHGINIHYTHSSAESDTLSPELIKYFKNRTTLRHAVINGAIEMVKLLMERGADGIHGGWDTDLFLLSLERESEEIPLWLLSNYKFDTRHPPEWIHEALEAALAYGHKQVYKIISAHVPDATLSNSHKQVYKNISAHAPSPIVNEDIYHLDVSRVKKFIDDGFPPDNKTLPGADSPLCFACMYDRAEIARVLIEAGADVNFKCAYGRTPLMYATGKNNLVLCEALLAKGADINARTQGGDTILMDYSTIENLTEDMIRWLIDKGADINYRDGERKVSVLSNAFHFGSSALVKILLERGADGAQDGWHEQAFIESLRRPDDELSLHLIHKYKGKGLPGGSSAFYTGVEFNKNRIVKLMLELATEKEKENLPREKGFQSALHSAAYSGNMEACELLLEFVEQVRESDTLDGPLQVASQYDNQDIVSLLLEKGADVNSKDYQGNTPLILAASGGHTELVQLLLEEGADIQAKNNLGWTALMQAAVYRHPETMKFLLSKGAIARDKAENERNITPLMVACDSGVADSVKLLLEHGADPFAVDDVGLTAHKYAEFAIPFRAEIQHLLPPVPEPTEPAAPLPKVDLKDCPICKGISDYESRRVSGFGEDYRKYFFKVMTLLEEGDEVHEGYKYYTRTSYYECPRCGSRYKKFETEDMDNFPTLYEIEVRRISTSDMVK